MTGARAATSLSLTIGIAFATLLVAGGIVTGPAILDCSHNPDGFGACLRGKVVQTGLLPADARPLPLSALSSELSSAELTSPPIVAAVPLPKPGWMAANATEYEPPPPSVAALSGEPGRVDAAGTAPGAAEAAAEIALAEPAGEMRARGLIPAGDNSGAEVALAEPAGRLSVDGAAVAISRTGDVSLVPRVGSIEASGRGLPGATASGRAITEPLPQGRSVVSGRIGRNASAAGRAALAATLVADLSPAPALEQIAVAPQILPPKLDPRRLTSPPRAAALRDPKPMPSPPVKYDPRYPNVLVLPPPNRGENSSFATLEVR